jgi:predicted tellurium resistance membrane protein TerC
MYMLNAIITAIGKTQASWVMYSSVIVSVVFIIYLTMSFAFIVNRIQMKTAI